MTEKLDRLSEREKVNAKLRACDSDFAFFSKNLSLPFVILSNNLLSI